MSSIPSAKGIDSTLALLRNTHGFIPEASRALEGEMIEQPNGYLVPASQLQTAAATPAQ